MTQPTMSEGPATVLCTYRVKQGQEKAFIALLDKHWPTLHGLGLTTEDPSQVFRGSDEKGKPYFVEIFTWKSGESPGAAHHLPEVMAVWEPMGGLCEARGDRPSMEFPHVEPLKVGRGKGK